MRRWLEGEGPKVPKRGYSIGPARPDGNRASRRAYAKQVPKSQQRQAYVVEAKSHMWDPDGLCVLHNARCEPRPG